MNKDSKKDVHDFWYRNINAINFLTEEIGTKEFFEEAERVRYKYHYHLLPLFEHIANVCWKDSKLLEIGCSMGTDLLQLARKGIKVTGVDLTENAIELAKKRFTMYGIEADLRMADAENLPFSDNEFDAVYSFGVLHHTPDTQKSIQEVHRVLKPNGKAFIMLYHRFSLNYFAHWVTRIPFDGSKKDRCPVERTYYKKEICELFSDFSKVDIKIDYLFGTGWGIVNSLTPKFIHRFLGKIIGWHIIIEEEK